MTVPTAGAEGLLDALPALVWRSGPDAQVQYVNATWLAFTGRAPGDEHGVGWLGSIHPDERAEVARQFVTSVRERRPFELQYRFRRGDGEYRWVLNRGVPAARGAEPGAFIGVALDIQAAHDQLTLAVAGQTAAEAERYRAEVGERQAVAGQQVAEEARRAAEDAQRRAEEAQRVAEAAQRERDERSAELARSNAELEQFAYVASHDLQEPLRMVASYVQLLAKRYQGRLDADADKFIGYAVDGAARMQRLINDLLAFSRVGTRQTPPAPVDTEAMVAGTLRDLEAPLRDSGGKVSHGPLPPVLADGRQVGQLFQNLIGNALKFRRAEPPEVRITAERKGGWVEFQVEDNGIGIDPQFFDRIFIIFQRLHGPTKYPGTGIGLALCKKIVERHRGTMWVDSTPGRGSRFHFTLPAATEALTS